MTGIILKTRIERNIFWLRLQRCHMIDIDFDFQTSTYPALGPIRPETHDDCERELWVRSAQDISICIASVTSYDNSNDIDNAS